MTKPSVFPGLPLTKRGVVLAPGPQGAWDAGMVESPVVWWDAAHGRYAMVYTGYAWTNPSRRGYDTVATPQVGLAWSDDLLRWHKDPRNPIFGPTGDPATLDACGTAGPFVWAEGGRYHLFYFGTTAPGYERGLKALHLATSTDLVRWQRHPANPVVAPHGQGWRREAIWHPNVVRHAGRYYLFFNASGLTDGCDEEFVGYAVSDDLRAWTVDDAHAPLLVGSRRAGAWDATGRTGDPSVFRVGDFWFMAYYSWDGRHTQDGLAWTTAAAFPLGWQPYDGNPVLPIGRPGTFDALHAGKPFVVRTAQAHFHFYTAVADDETRQIALATGPL